MPTIHAEVESSLPPERVLAAAHDFSGRRAEVFPAVSVELMQVHEAGDNSADVTEETKTGPFGTNWERCRYDWSHQGSVIAQVTDSNVYEPDGSRWEIRASAKDSGSHVDMIWVRDFRHGGRGRVFGTLFRVVGRPIFAKYARDVIRNLEELEAGGRAT